jgi:CRP-like cAMP-binding protein
MVASRRRSGRLRGRQRSPAEGDLRRSVLFSGLSASSLSELVSGSRIVRLERAQRLWKEGEAPGHLGLVLSGRLKSIRERGRRQAIVDIALPGDLLGDLAFVLGEPLPATVLALRASRVLLVPSRLVREAFEREPRALWPALVSFGRRVQRLMRLVDGLTSGTVARRLAAALFGLAQRTGEPFPGGLLVPLRLHRADLAALAATTAESVSRHLGTWTRQGVITPQPAGYLIRDLAGLGRLAGDGTD